MAFCWPSRAMFALATPGKRGLIQHGIPVRPDSRPGDSPASANFHLRTEERLPEKGPRHGAQFGCGTLRAGLMPLANAGIAVVRWRTSAERWRREDFWTEAVPVSVVPSWHGTWVRRGPRAPVFPNRETHHPAPGRPERLRLPALSMRFTELPPMAQGRISASPGPLPFHTEAWKPGS
jgi:hypothetical protein